MDSGSPTRRGQRPGPSRWLQSGNDITQQFLAIGGRSDMVSLAGGLPAAEFYPVEPVREAAQRALHRWGSAALEYGPVEGLGALRECLAARVSRETGARFEASHVLLTTGSMQGLDLLGKALLDPGDTIVAQTPTYVGALDAWRPRYPKYAPLDWTCERPGRAETMAAAKFVYAVPNYSNPTGVLVPEDRRRALFEEVAAAGPWLVEDDPYRAIRFGDVEPPTLLALGSRPGERYDGPVIYLGTLSKSIVPGLRVGWIVAAPEAITMLAMAKQSSDLSSSLLTQAIALELMEQAFDLEHGRRITALYRTRRDALCDAAREGLAEWFEWEVPSGGMFVWMRARNRRTDTSELYRYALEERVAFVPGVVFDPEGKDRSAMRLNFTRAGPEALAEGVRRLRRATERYFLAHPAHR